jgi:hypothetical protein
MKISLEALFGKAAKKKTTFVDCLGREVVADDCGWMWPLRVNGCFFPMHVCTKEHEDVYDVQDEFGGGTAYIAFEVADED